MKELLLNDTIAAISTPIGRSGIGIVRLSGRNALSIADKVFAVSNGLCPSKFPSHTLHYGWIIDSSQLTAHSSQKKSSFTSKPEYIDEVLLTVMRAPRTYTKENIVEINCHSGIVVLRKILQLVLNCGARLASPGEFTRRAYLNGRIDLAQAEAVMDIVNSETGDALRSALGQLQGRLSVRIKALRKNIMDILIQLESSIDFSDQNIELDSREGLSKRMKNISQDLKKLLDTADKGKILREGISCVICGKPNVGKSSLLNALLKKDRAIVTDIPGTTRDSLEETIDLCGIPLRLIDTAGIIKGRDLVEKEAVRRSRRCLEQADFALLVLDASGKLTPEDFAISRYIYHKPAIIVLNKQDLPIKTKIGQAKRILPGKKALSISALRGRGLDRLEKEIAEFIWQGKSKTCSEILVTNIRHSRALKSAQRSLRRAIKTQKEGRGAEIITLEVKEAQSSLGEIIGKISNEDILQQIFTQFCIGK